ncbi:MAG: hypothetical protein GY950_08490 [bacterium]|nr:hypothetical protein [bacterium]
MKREKTSAMLVVFFVLVAVVVVVSPGFALIDSNGAGTGYEGGDPPGGTSSYASSNGIEYYIEEGIGYYLGAREKTDALLRMVESQSTQGVDFNELKTAVDGALDNINSAAATFGGLIQKAESTPYNSSVISLLKEFDYDAFGLENGLNGIIFSEVEEFLKSGDITGVFKRKHSDFLKIAALLNPAKNEIYDNRIPGVSGLWELNEVFSESSLFGSYVARVFKKINE